MRLIFGVLSLLVVLAVVGTVAKSQLKALGSVAPSAAMPGAQTAAPPANSTVAGQARSIQDNVRNAANAAIEQGAKRAAEQ